VGIIRNAKVHFLDKMLIYLVLQRLVLISTTVLQIPKFSKCASILIFQWSPTHIQRKNRCKFLCRIKYLSVRHLYTARTVFFGIFVRIKQMPLSQETVRINVHKEVTVHNTPVVKPALALYIQTAAVRRSCTSLCLKMDKGGIFIFSPS